MSHSPSPRLVLVGGPNGAGKTTFARLYARSEGLPYLGADDIALQLSPLDPARARVAAGREFSKRLGAALQASESLVIESTLSGASLARSIAKARERGYEVTLVFVFLDSAELCLRRIAERVAQGGHDVPEEDVRRRFLRAAPVFWHQYRPLAHQSMVVFNGGESFLVVAETQDGQWQVYDEQMWTAFQALLPTPKHDPSEEG
ncbi:AAA family ATPase [Azohydromonas aeria]|uniref:AAA family ATPase n=1 Tax=Azohydromonas aeria TaxID=2590212 RepID=UPI0012FC9F83|nr:AAA family ATPase [Azohydromonas aeria]